LLGVPLNPNEDEVGLFLVILGSYREKESHSSTCRGSTQVQGMGARKSSSNGERSQPISTHLLSSGRTTRPGLA